MIKYTKYLMAILIVGVATTDSIGNPYSQPSFVINITNVSDQPPTNITLSDNTVDENSPVGTNIGTLSTIDLDVGDMHSYRLGNEADASAFQIVEDTLKTNSLLDFETKNSYTLSITTDDGNGGSFDKTFTITVNNINEAPTGFVISDSPVSIMESIQDIAIVTFSNVQDPEPGDGHTFSIEEDNVPFNIVGTELRVNGRLDYETQTQYTLTIIVTDQGNLTFQQVLIVNITNVDDEDPTDITLSSNTIRENSPANTLIGTLTSIDPDDEGTPTNNYTYSLTGSDAAHFSIMNTDELFSRTANFDFETKATYDITITTEDMNGRTFMKNFTINVTDVNEGTNNGPTGIMLSNNSVDENSPIGTTIGTLSTMDPDAGDTHIYTLTTPNDTFQIVGDTLKTNRNLDFETKSTYTLSITTTDGDGSTFDTTFTITVNEINKIVNSVPTDITLSNNAVAENSPVGSFIGTLSTIDLDVGDMHSYRLGNEADASAFQIVEDTLKTNSLLDFETKNSYTLSITTDDGNGGSFDKTFTITVNNINEAPTGFVISDSPVSIMESIQDIAIVTFSNVQDPEPGDGHTFSIEEDNVPFNIVGTELRVNGRLDYETQTQYTLTIIVTDQGNLTFQQVLIVNITNVDDEDPTDITLSSNTIRENSPANTLIGTLTSIDPDDEGTPTNNYTYSLTGSDAAHFSIMNTDELFSRTANFDFETKATYDITITTEDMNGRTFMKNFTINVTDVNEGTNNGPTGIMLSNNSVDENSPIGTTIGTLSTMDPDAGDTHIYTLTTPNDTFQIVGDTLKTNRNLDFETKSTYTLSITTTDGDGSTFDTTFTITVNEINKIVNSVPTDITLSNNAVAENSPVGSFIGTLSSTDPDAGDTHTYTLTTPNDTFLIVEDTLKTNSVFDFETKNSYSLSITTTDSSGSTFDKMFTINVTDSNDVPTDINLSNNVVERATSIGTVIGNFTATDPDNGDSHTFTLTSDIFQIVGDTLKTKALLEENTYSISVTADDGNGRTFSQDFTIMALDFVILLSNNSIAENQPVGTTISLLSTSDDTNDSGRTFTLGDMTNFAIVGDTLKSNLVFDYEEGNNSRSIEISTTDDTGGNYSQSFVINITNVSDQPPTDITLSNNTVDEDQPVGTTIGTLSTTDADAGDTHTYTLTTPNDTFQIVGDTLKTNSVLDFETKSSYSLSITTTDNSGGSFDKTFTITVNDLDENANNNPTDITLSNDSIDENALIGTTIGTLTTTDLDSGDTHTYTLTTPNDTFLIDGDTLKTNRAFDFETQSSYSLSITTTDSSGGTFDKMFTITINDVEENTNSDPTDITLSNNTVDENSPVGTEIGRLFTVDPDAGDTHTYTLTTPNDTFLIVGDTLKTNSVLDFETKSSYSLSITTTDNSGGSFDKTFTITVNDVKEDGALSINEVDHLVQVLPVFVKDKCALNIEHAFIGKVVVNMYTLNGTTAKTLVYNKNSRNMSKNIPVTLLPSGVYIVKIQFGKFVALKKIVKH